MSGYRSRSREPVERRTGHQEDCQKYKLFIGHLQQDVRQADLERFFKDNGFSKNIYEVVAKPGYGFVVFTDERDAEDAIAELHDKEFDGDRITVAHARAAGGRDERRSPPRGYGGSRENRENRRDDRGGYDGGRGGGGRGDGGRGDGGQGDGGGGKFGRPFNTEFRIIVDNVSSRASWQDVKDHFRKAGEVAFTKCHRERMNEAIVEYAKYADMKRAMQQLQNSDFFGKKITLTNTYPMTPPGSRSRSPRQRSPQKEQRSPQQRSRSRSPQVHLRNRSPQQSQSSRSSSRSVSPPRRSP